jgi:hypothetical protein
MYSAPCEWGWLLLHSVTPGTWHQFRSVDVGGMFSMSDVTCSASAVVAMLSGSGIYPVLSVGGSGGLSRLTTRSRLRNDVCRSVPAGQTVVGGSISGGLANIVVSPSESVAVFSGLDISSDARALSANNMSHVAYKLLL